MGHDPPHDGAKAVDVTVTYLRSAVRPIRATGPVRLRLELVERPDVAFYRFLYDTVGERWIWWRRRLMSDADLAAHLGHPDTKVYALYDAGQPFGFLELDLRCRPDIDLAYFGLLPFAIGTGVGGEALRLALDAAWSWDPEAVTVNTCTADHPRALGAYMKAGFIPVAIKQERWIIPDGLGFAV